MPERIDLDAHPIHLGLGATAVAQPEFTGDMSWYMAYGQRHAADGAEGRLVALHTFSEPGAMREMHPVGADVEATVLFITAGQGTEHRQR